MKQKIFYTLFLLAVAIVCTAQTSKLVATYIRAEEGLRVGTSSSTQITGFNTTIPALATDTKLPTTKAVKDWAVSSFLPLGSTASGDLSGTYPAPTVDGLQGVPVSAVAPTTGQVLKYNGTAWAPGSESDPSTTNELQTLSLSGQNLSLSLGGGTVSLPSSADGNGIYGGSGTVPAGTVATATEDFRIKYQDGNGYETFIGINGGTINLQANGDSGASNFSLNNAGSFTMAGSQNFTLQDNSGDKKYFSSLKTGNNFTVKIGQNESITPDAVFTANVDEDASTLSAEVRIIGAGATAKIVDESSEGFGLQYGSNLSATIATNDRSIPDVGTIKSGLIPNIPRQIAESAALNGEMFYSTDASKLAYKDAGGTITYLW